ncbi:class I SAM-dependent methyltransferase [Sporomusa acidovorans]|uniref:Methyltransferase type 12 domain-containing protein n=1 Tax=Sporomusa acidovorans (strain ATCC 49682 / DSM 3132 / Mol) TaxID=1123286 RepID=A0ABZ3JAC8_SPOA4|nr:class I SAM-dependent methyltransferase [Sporomusa acidovorans]OZC15138.1 methyltransferase domain protein [Sporomusa acidovorans DSM 3132]SDF44089.1 Methyltransferase domain-containing protein [Sporomusa acidovorans]
MIKSELFERFKRITFDDFRNLAVDETLSENEKIGFPDGFRANGNLILNDIISKLPQLLEDNIVAMDIGCGCGELASTILEFCEKRNHKLILIDSEEMLSHLTDTQVAVKIPCRFPFHEGELDKYADKIDVIIVYSVLQHLIVDGSLYNFIDEALRLLKNGGKLLLGDIPNITKRKRFFSSQKGIETHQNFTGTSEIPTVNIFQIEQEKVDDGIIFGILQRYRGFGYETYLLPQSGSLPMSTRREDILIIKPE